MRSTPGSRSLLWDSLVLFGLIAVGVALRLSHAWRGAPWRDEAQLLNIVALPTDRAMMDFIMYHESHPPLYYFLWRWLTAGRAWGDHALVVPGIVLGSLTILLAWWLGRRLGSGATGWTAGLLVALSPKLIETDATVRPYSFTTLVLLCATAFLWRALSTGSGLALAGWALAGVILLYTHNWTVLPVVAAGVVALWLALSHRSALTPRAVLLAGVVMVLCWAPWWPALLYQAQHGGQLLQPDPLSRAPWLLVSSIPGLSIDAGIVLAAGLGAVFLIRKGRIQTSESTGKWLILTGLGTLLVTLAATLGSFRTELLVTHTLPILAPPILIGVAVILTAPATSGVLLARTALLLVLLMSARDATQMAVSPRSNADTVARHLSSAARPGDLIVLVPGNLISSFERYYRGAAPLYPFPEGHRVRPFDFSDRTARESDPAVVAAAIERVAGTLADGDRVWVLSIGVEGHLSPAWNDLIARLRVLGGTPAAVVPDDAMRGATLERIGVQLWTRK